MINFLLKVFYFLEYLFANNSNEKEFLKKYFKRKKIIYVDIGANFGNYFKFLRENIYLKKSFLIEPGKKAFDYLNLNLKKSNCIVINQALSDKKKNVLFFEYNISSLSSLYKVSNKISNFSFEKYKIITNTLDKLFDVYNMKKIDFIKIDAQDEDLKILHGSKKLLRDKKIGLIKIEINFLNKIQKDYAKKIFKFLFSYNYSLIYISKIKYQKNNMFFVDAYFKLC